MRRGFFFEDRIGYDGHMIQPGRLCIPTKANNKIFEIQCSTTVMEVEPFLVSVTYFHGCTELRDRSGPAEALAGKGPAFMSWMSAWDLNGGAWDATSSIAVTGNYIITKRDQELYVSHWCLKEASKVRGTAGAARAIRNAGKVLDTFVSQCWTGIRHTA